MSTLEILLLVAGALAFISSFFLPDGKAAQNAEISEEELRARVDEAIENSRARIDDMSEESIRYSMERTERALDKMTNEKMMALGEYSDTILNQIAQNHQETVFLHDMLNRSKDELAELLNRAEKASKDADKRANGAYDLARNAEKLAAEVKERVEESSRAAMAAEEKMIDARRMLQEMPVRREELSTQAGALVRAVEKQEREEEAYPEKISPLAEEAEVIPEAEPETEMPLYEETDELLQEEIQDFEDEQPERSAYEELSESFESESEAAKQPEEEEIKVQEQQAAGEIVIEVAPPAEPVAEKIQKQEVPERRVSARAPARPVSRPVVSAAEDGLSEEEKMERILQAAAAELADERKRPQPAAKKTQAAEPVIEKPKEEVQPVTEKHSTAAARALLESVSMSPALGEDFAGGKRPVAGERISRTSVKRKPRNSVKRTLSDVVKGQMSIPEEFLPQKEAPKETAPRAKESVSLQFAPGENSANHNERILQMHRMGRSNMAIAKDLGLGIGEVKLVIDLYENMQ